MSLVLSERKHTVNHTTERFPRAARYSAMRSEGAVSGPYRRTLWAPIDWRRVCVGVMLGAFFVATLAVI